MARVAKIKTVETPKRKYTKKVSKMNVIRTKPAAKKPVGRPKKAK